MLGLRKRQAVKREDCAWASIRTSQTSSKALDDEASGNLNETVRIREEIGPIISTLKPRGKRKPRNYGRLNVY